MVQTTLSEKFQVVIPKVVRDHMGYRPGQRFAVVEKGSVVVLVPLPRETELRGRLKGASPEGYRDRSDVA